MGRGRGIGGGIAVSDSISQRIFFFPLFFCCGKERFLPSFSFFESTSTEFSIPFIGYY